MALGARTFCEIVIVSLLNRWPNNVLEIYRAREICYGLFSAGFAFMMYSSIPRTSEEDPWEIDNLETTRQEAESRAGAEDLRAELQKTLDRWPEEAHQRFEKKVQDWTGRGQTAAPDVGQILNALRDDVKAETKGAADDRLLQGRLEFLDRMQEDISNWVPIYKWDGRDPEGDALSSATDNSDTMSQVSSTVFDRSPSVGPGVARSTSRMSSWRSLIP